MAVTPAYLSVTGGVEGGLGVRNAILSNAPDIASAPEATDVLADTAVTDSALAVTAVEASDTAAGTGSVSATAADTAAAKGTTGGTHYDAFVTALGLLVAQGAAPDEAHVTAVNDAFTLLAIDTAAAKVATATAATDAAATWTATGLAATAAALVDTDVAAVKVATAANVGTGTLQGYDVVLMYDTTAVATKSKLRAILRTLAAMAQNSGDLTGV